MPRPIPVRIDVLQAIQPVCKASQRSTYIPGLKSGHSHINAQTDRHSLHMLAMDRLGGVLRGTKPSPRLRPIIASRGANRCLSQGKRTINRIVTANTFRDTVEK